MSFSALLKQQDLVLYNQYLMSKFGNKIKRTNIEITKEKPKFKAQVIPDGVVKLTELPKDHPAVVYIESRNIPNIHKLYYTDDFQGWVNEQIPQKFKKPIKEARVVIPFLTKEGNLFGFQGRSLNPNSQVRYITITLDDEAIRLFGQETVDRAKPVYVVEGPIDSMFLDNGMAMCGSDLSIVHGMYRDVVLVWDNEPRAKIIITKIERAINKGCSVVIWNAGNQKKDINDMVLDGQDVNKLVRERTFTGIKAKIELARWKKTR